MTQALKVLASDGFNIEVVKEIENKSFLKFQVAKGLELSELKNIIKDIDFLIVRSATKANKDLLSVALNLKGIIRAGVGVDNIDITLASEMGIWVWNAPTGNYQSAAEHALALLFALSRKIVPATIAGQNGKWSKKDIGESGRQLNGLTLGLFGAGHIGSRVAKMAKGIGMQVQICDPFFEPSPDRPFKKVDFDTLVKTSDALSIHTPLTPDTKHIFNQEVFKKMKPSIMIINAARGGIIHEGDLLEALEKNLIEGVALDVFEKEPFEGEFYNKLLSHPRVISTPHLGASTKEAQVAVGFECLTLLEQIHIAFANKRSDLWPKALNKPKNPRIEI